MTAYYSPSRDLPLDLNPCSGCGAPTMAPDRTCVACACQAIHERAEAQRKAVTEIHTALARSAVSRRFLAFAGVVKGGAR